MANLSPTQPQRRNAVEAQATSPSKTNSPAHGSNKSIPPKNSSRPGCLRGFLRSPIVVTALTVLLGLLLVSAASAAVGWSLGSGEYNATATIETGLYLLDQYNLALADMEKGQYSLAQQRLEFIFAQDPEFLDVRDQLVNVMVIVGSNQQPTGVTPLEATATPTQDPRPKEELFGAAQALINAHDWTAAIDTLLALRKADPNYRTADVDGWMYAALRNRGVEHILQRGLFEPGLYDFALAETFGPLDNEAHILREGARYFLFGNAFWLAYPQDAAYYYGLSMAVAPGLIDSTGQSAFSRYWQSLVQYADQLASDGQWCDAYDAYQDALRARADSEVQATAQAALVECVGPSDTPSNTAVFTLTPSFTVPGPTVTPSSTNTPGTPTDSETPTATAPPPSDTPTPTASDTPTPETPTTTTPSP